MTLRSPIFRKLLGSAIVLVGVTLLGLDFYLTRYTAQREVVRARAAVEIADVAEAHRAVGIAHTAAVRRIDHPGAGQVVTRQTVRTGQATVDRTAQGAGAA